MKQENQEKRVQTFELALEQWPQLSPEILDELKQMHCGTDAIMSKISEKK
jgi:hypothetical protein